MVQINKSYNTLSAKQLNVTNTFDIAGTQVTSTAAELNLNDNQVASASFTIGTESANTITVNVQLLDAAGSAMATRSAVGFYLSSDANGDSTAVAATSLAAGTDGVMQEYIANSVGQLISEADGDIDVVVGDTGTTTYYLILVMPNGSLVASGAITFA